MALGIPFACTDLNYPFSFLRLQAASLASPGVANAGDMTVSPSSGLQVQVSAGKASVQQTAVQAGESAFYKGNYFAFNDAAANPYNTISAPLVNPRVDMVVLRVYDVTEQGLGGSSYQRFEWVQGTETAGANVTPGSSGYLAGIAAVPANSLVLAYVLQTVGESSISSGNILNVAQLIYRGLKAISASGNVTAVSGQLIFALGASFNVTLPAPSANALVGVVNYWTLATGILPVRVVAPSGLIFGVGLGAAATSVLLGAQGALVVLQSDGTNWFVISGQQDTGWVTIASFGAGFTAAGLQVRLIGNVVRMRGSVNATATGNATITTLAAPYWPAVGPGPMMIAGGTTPPNYSINVSPSGLVSLFPASNNFDQYSLAGVSYLID